MPGGKMSRLQKKITAEDKKKKKEAKKSVTENENVSPVRPAAVSSPLKTKSDVPAATTKKNFIYTASEFLREVRVELKKVTWPTRKQTTGTTIVVIIFVFILAVFLGFFDYSLSKLVQVVLT
ncbi:MAG: preprotein translocase subunit SecE [Desulfotignum sp.]|nr:preprotein translocase subunit SecE [Desulfotignum sp.]